MMMLFAVTFGAVAWAGHTDASREIAQDIDAAFLDAGLTHKAAALTMGLTEPQLSRQLAGVEPLNLYRLAYLPRPFMVAFLARHAERVGGALITPRDKQYILGFIGIGKRKMAEMLSSLCTDERRVS